MRLDKFLKVSRLIKRRTVANSVSETGRVLINGNSAKPAKQLKIGDIIEIEYANRTEKVQVISIPEGNVSVQDAHNLYKVIE
ncbi:RNA-binding S4 domain-containing protein [bacterium]|nr:RNA-binding S4 domain-containing protein [bacterium]MBR1776453.1 RNA-binding S4 domain-containing protein [bacterium]